MNSDITKCNNTECKLRTECWRYMAPSKSVQSFAHFEPEWKEIKLICEMQIKIENNHSL